MKSRVLALIALVLTLVQTSSMIPVYAQGDDALAFNEPVIVSLSAGVNVTKTFSVLEGDRFELRLSRLAEFAYTAVLLDPAQAATPLTAAPDGNAVLIVERVPVGGTYQLVLQATSGSGDMLIQLLSTAVEPEPLSLGNFTINLAELPLRYRLEAPPGTGPTLLSLSADLTLNPAARLPGLVLADATSGQTVLTLGPAMLPRLTLSLVGDTVYILALEPGQTPQPVLIGWQAETSGLTVPVPTTTPPSITSPNTGGQCLLFLSGAVNVRSGPGVEYDPPIGQAQAGSTLAVTGQNGTYTWYQVDFGGQLGWVSGGIDAVQVQGNCTTLPVASYPPPPVAPLQPGVPTNTPPAGPTATSPAGPTATQPAGPTATYTPSYTPPPPVAPPDSNYAMAVPLDGTATLSDYVSYPGGDVEDFVGYSVTGLNPNVAFSGGQADLSIQLLCQGTGSETIVFRVDGVNFSCGQTFTRRVNFDSNTGGVRITATGGTATYVQWTLQAQAPRVN